MKSLGIKLISFIFLSFLIQSSFQSNLDISIELIKNFINPSGFIFQLIKLRLIEMDEDFSCTLCKRLTDAVRTTVEEKYTPDELIHIAVLFCSFGKSYDYCNSFLSSFGIPLLKNVFLRLTNSDNFCHTLGFCPEGEECEDTYDYAIRLLKDKPNKKREPIDTTAPILRML